MKEWKETAEKFMSLKGTYLDIEVGDVYDFGDDISEFLQDYYYKGQGSVIVEFFHTEKGTEIYCYVEHIPAPGQPTPPGFRISIDGTTKQVVDVELA